MIRSTSVDTRVPFHNGSNLTRARTHTHTHTHTHPLSHAPWQAGIARHLKEGLRDAQSFRDADAMLYLVRIAGTLARLPEAKDALSRMYPLVRPAVAAVIALRWFSALLSRLPWGSTNERRDRRTGDSQQCRRQKKKKKKKKKKTRALYDSNSRSAGARKHDHGHRAGGDLPGCLLLPLQPDGP